MAVGLVKLGPTEQAAAACVKLGKKCRTKDGERLECCGVSKCRGGTCKCPGGRVRCRKVCCARGDVCAGGKCVTGRGTCGVNDDFCVDNEVGCSGDEDCFCIKNLAGQTRCVRPAPGSIACGECESDEECEPFGDLAFCAATECCGAPDGFCAVPCSE